MPSRQINDFFLQKGNRKKIELVARPARKVEITSMDGLNLEYMMTNFL